jgi:ABC-type transport system substrate-binding protein
VSAAVVVLAMVAAACTTATTTTGAGGGTTQAPGTTTAGGGETTTTAAAEVVDYTFRIGAFADSTTDNFWAFYGDSAQNSVWNDYLLTPTRPILWGLTAPGWEFGNDVAADAEVPTGAAEGDGWAIEVKLRDDAIWSDGTPITADDIAFTFATVQALGLGSNWGSAFPLADPADPAKIGLTGVTAVDPTTVTFQFNQEPGLSVWQYGAAQAPIMNKAFWNDKVEAAKASNADPVEQAKVLLAESGQGDPSGGSVVFTERVEGSHALNSANLDYYDKGREITSGGVTYPLGPFVEGAEFRLYGSQDAALLALKNGDIDYIINPLGMSRGLASQVEQDANLQPVVNPTNGFRYMAFNFRRAPMNIKEFRQAVEWIIDKEYATTNILGTGFPLYSLIPEGNTKWYDEERAAAIAGQYKKPDGTPFTLEERLAKSVELLKAGGFTWTTDPAMAANGREITAGQGLMLNGEPFTQEVELLYPTSAYDPLRFAMGAYVSDQIGKLGFNVVGKPTEFNAILDQIFTPLAEGDVDFDIYILGYSLGILPDYLTAFFHSRNDLLNQLNNPPTGTGDNNGGYNNPAYDAIADQFSAATDEAAAKDLAWQMEEIVADELPYIVLFDTGIAEAYRKAGIAFPFEQTLSGLQFLQGMQNLATAAK